MKAIFFKINSKSISRKSIERLDLLLIVLETIDLNGSESMYSISNDLSLQEIFPTKVSIWKLRCNNPLRKTYISNNLKDHEFEALLKITSEMAKYLYPYIRSLLASLDNYNSRPKLWNDFQYRLIDLIKQRFNTESVLVKKLVDLEYSKNFYRKILITLAMCQSEDGYNRLKIYLLNL